MERSVATARPAEPARRIPTARRRRYVPPQHGAWAMLAVPYLAGLIAAGFAWPDLPLLILWLAGYLLSYFVFQAAKSRRPARYRAQFLLYGGVALPMAAIVLAARPVLLWYAPVYAALFGVNVWHAVRRRERDLANDVASVLQSCLMVPVVATVADVPPTHVLGAFLLCAAYFVGTVFYVKTMIRERGNAAFRRWSIGYHGIAFAAAAWLSTVAWLSPWAAALFAWLLVRAVVLPGRAWSPKRVGLVEIANSVALLAVVALL